MKIQLIICSFFIVLSLNSHAEEWSVESSHLISNKSIPVVVVHAVPQVSMGFSEFIYALMFNEEGVRATLSEEHWISASDVDASGLVIQRQKGALYLQYRF